MMQHQPALPPSALAAPSTPASLLGARLRRVEAARRSNLFSLYSSRSSLTLHAVRHCGKDAPPRPSPLARFSCAGPRGRRLRGVGSGRATRARAQLRGEVATSINATPWDIPRSATALLASIHSTPASQRNKKRTRNGTGTSETGNAASLRRTSRLELDGTTAATERSRLTRTPSRHRVTADNALRPRDHADTKSEDAVVVYFQAPLYRARDDHVFTGRVGRVHLVVHSGVARGLLAVGLAVI